MNISELLARPDVAEGRVLRIQAKLHRWANDDPVRRFGDLFNFVYDPAVLVVAWRRVVGNKGARTAGVDGLSARQIARQSGEASFLEQVRADVKTRTFEPLPVRERLIPKPRSRKVRRLGIQATRDRVVQAALKIVLEPIFEADSRISTALNTSRFVESLLHVENPHMVRPRANAKRRQTAPQANAA